MKADIQNKLAQLTVDATKFSVQNVVNKSWNIFGRVALFAILALLIYLVLAFVIQTLVGFLFPVDDTELIILSQSSNPDIDEMMEAIQNIATSPNYMISSLLSMVVVALVSPILYGIIYLAYKADHNQTISFSDVFYAYQDGRFGKSVMLALISSLIISIGMALCILPGVIIAIGLTLAIPFLLFAEASPIEAMKASFRVVFKNFGGFILIFLVFVLLVLLGALMCGVGLLATIPLIYIIVYVLYKEVIGFELRPDSVDIGTINRNPYQ